MSIYISRDGSVIFTVLFGTFLNLMYCMVVFYMSTGSPNKQGAESFRSLLIKHFFSIFSFGVSRPSLFYSRAECLDASCMASDVG